MSIIDTYDDRTEALLTPEKLVAKIDGFPKVAVAVFMGQILDALCENYETEVIAQLRAGIPHPVYRVSYKGRDIAVYRTIIGGAGTTGLMEEIHAMGAEKFVIFGSCGTLDQNISAGRFILPTAAYRDEGVSYHYAPAGDYINIPTVNRLAEIFDELKLPYVKGKTWTTDAIYRETRGNMQKRKAEGCLCVEMECASIMAAGQFRGVPVYQFLYGEDTLDGDDWEQRTMGNVAKSDFEKYLALGLEVAARV